MTINNKVLRPGFFRKIEEPYRINERITAPAVRIVGEGITTDVYPLQRALELAASKGLDLVEISPQADPPVCKIVDYAKFKYEQNKKQKEIRAKSQKTMLKEIRLGPNTDEHDFNFKLKHAIKFLQEGIKVKVYIHFIGRSIIFKERGEVLLLKFAQGTEEYGKVEYMPKLEGRRMHLCLISKHTKGS